MHVNGYFELSSNRRDIWSGADTSGEAKLRSDWNNCLARDVLAPLYAESVKHVFAQQCKGTELKDACTQLLSLLPVPLPTSGSPLWNVLARETLKLLKTHPLLYCGLKSGSLVSMAEARLLPVPANEKVSDLESRETLEALLITEGMSVAVLSKDLCDVLVECGCTAGVVSPSFVRDYFVTAGKARCIQPPHTRQEAWAKALFLLKYCLQDLHEADFDTLIGLPFLPMSDSSVSCIGSSIDTPVYLASEAERAILVGSEGHILTSEISLGPAVMSVFQSPAFQESSNVRSLSQVDVLRLLKHAVPVAWFAAETKRVNSHNVVSAIWLANLWDYSLAAQCLSLFLGVLPMLPVLDPLETLNTAYLVKLDNDTPVLAYAAFTPVVSQCLFDMGIYTFNPTLLPRLAYSPEVLGMLLPSTSVGLMEALGRVSGDLTSDIVSRWTSTSKDVFCEFILDHILSGKAESLLADQQLVLTSLPIWNCHNSDLPTTVYTTLDPAIHKLSPPTLKHFDLLDKSFVRLRSESDRGKYALLGLTEHSPSLGVFYLIYAFPRLRSGQLPADAIDRLATDVLEGLACLTGDSADFVGIASQVPFIRAQSGDLVCATQLFDPDVPLFRSLLPVSSFPSAALYSAPPLLTALRALGMQCKIEAPGVLQAARGIELDLEASALATPSLEALTAKARGLLTYLEMNIDALLEEVDPDSWCVYKEGKGAASDDGSTQQMLTTALGGSWGNDLRSIKWIPALTASPLGAAERDLLPWPVAVHQHPFATPSQCRPSEDMWLCSQTHRISVIDTTSEAVRELLSWTRPLSGRYLAMQIIKIAEAHAALPVVESDFKRTQLNELCLRANRQLMGRLHQAYTHETSVQSQSWLKLLAQHSFLWIDNGFVDASRLAFSLPSGSSLEPHFYAVPSAAVKYSELLQALGVRATLDAQDVVHMLSEMYRLAEGQRLNHQKLEVTVSYTSNCYSFLLSVIYV